MRVKRFVADSMQEAIALVKADFGKDAVILHTKKIRRDGLLGLLGRSRVEVIAAVDGPAAAPRADREARLSGHGPPPARVSPGDAVAQRELAQIRRELDEIRRALGQRGRAESEPPAIERMRRRLLEQEVQPQLVEEILASVRSQAGEMRAGQEEWLERAVRAEIAKEIASIDPWQVTGLGRVQCLVGPTGVGKTTTVAKLAANFALLAGKRVALVTVDTYRIAAVEQLKTYAEIIGVPVDVAFTPQEFREAIARRSDYDMILVDTAGRSQKNTMQMAELRAFLEVVKDPVVHLVLSATTRMRDMADVIERFSQLPISCVIMTKLDETSTFGSLLNACKLSGKPLSYVTDGQSVPDDIEVADADRIADMILGVRA